MRHGEYRLRKGILGDHVHKNEGLNFLDKVVLWISFIFPFTALPQIYKIWYFQNAVGVSLLSWGMFALFTVPLLFYGIVHKIKPIIVLNFLWLLMYVPIIVGILIYG